MTDPLKIVAGLKPALLDQMAEEAYQRRRAADLARAMAATGTGRGVPGRPGRPGPGHRRWRLLAASGAVSAAAAVTALALTGSLAGQPAHPAQSQTGAGAPSGTPQEPVLDARAFLLSSAEVISRTPATAGTYWYVKERDFEPTSAAPQGRRVGAPPVKKVKPVLPAAKGRDYAAYFAATEESWTGQSKARTIVNEDLAFGFASAADEARWGAAGNPPLLNPGGGAGYTGTRASDYSMTFYFGYGAYRLSLDGVRALPGTQGALAATLRQMWNTEPDKQAAVGPADPTFSQYVFTWAGALLGGPASRSTKAALCRLLAAQPGIQVMPQVTDPLGRTGVAVGDGTGSYLIIDQRTGQLLATTSSPVHAGSTIRAAAGATEAIITEGWTGTLGTPAG